MSKNQTPVEKLIPLFFPQASKHTCCICKPPREKLVPASSLINRIVDNIGGTAGSSQDKRKRETEEERGLGEEKNKTKKPGKINTIKAPH